MYVGGFSDIQVFGYEPNGLPKETFYRGFIAEVRTQNHRTSILACKMTLKSAFSSSSAVPAKVQRIVGTKAKNGVEKHKTPFTTFYVGKVVRCQDDIFYTVKALYDAIKPHAVFGVPSTLSDEEIQTEVSVALAPSASMMPLPGGKFNAVAVSKISGTAHFRTNIDTCAFKFDLHLCPGDVMVVETWPGLEFMKLARKKKNALGMVDPTGCVFSKMTIEVPKQGLNLTRDRCPEYSDTIGEMFGSAIIAACEDEKSRNELPCVSAATSIDEVQQVFEAAAAVVPFNSALIGIIVQGLGLTTRQNIPANLHCLLCCSDTCRDYIMDVVFAGFVPVLAADKDSLLTAVSARAETKRLFDDGKIMDCEVVKIPFVVPRVVFPIFSSDRREVANELREQVRRLVLSLVATTAPWQPECPKLQKLLEEYIATEVSCGSHKMFVVAVDLPLELLERTVEFRKVTGLSPVKISFTADERAMLKAYGRFGVACAGDDFDCLLLSSQNVCESQLEQVIAIVAGESVFFQDRLRKEYRDPPLPASVPDVTVPDTASDTAMYVDAAAYQNWIENLAADTDSEASDYEYDSDDDGYDDYGDNESGTDSADRDNDGAVDDPVHVGIIAPAFAATAISSSSSDPSSVSASTTAHGGSITTDDVDVHIATTAVGTHMLVRDASVVEADSRAETASLDRDAVAVFKRALLTDPNCDLEAMAALWMASARERMHAVAVNAESAAPEGEQTVQRVNKRTAQVLEQTVSSKKTRTLDIRAIETINAPVGQGIRGSLSSIMATSSSSTDDNDTPAPTAVFDLTSPNTHSSARRVTLSPGTSVPAHACPWSDPGAFTFPDEKGKRSIIIGSQAYFRNHYHEFKSENAHQIKSKAHMDSGVGFCYPAEIKCIMASYISVVESMMAAADGDNILICCKSGRSRSPTYLVAYLVKKYKFCVCKAWLMVQPCLKQARRQELDRDRRFVPFMYQLAADRVEFQVNHTQRTLEECCDKKISTGRILRKNQPKNYTEHESDVS